MSVEKKPNQKNPPKSKLADTVDKYNPVNMADKKIEDGERPSHENKQVEEDYNPVNMAGKKAVTRKETQKQSGE
jgi:hypothetical protein